jgi:hypothetical protein
MWVILIPQCKYKVLDPMSFDPADYHCQNEED